MLILRHEAKNKSAALHSVLIMVINLAFLAIIVGAYYRKRVVNSNNGVQVSISIHHYLKNFGPVVNCLNLSMT